MYIKVLIFSLVSIVFFGCGGVEPLASSNVKEDKPLDEAGLIKLLMKSSLSMKALEVKKEKTEEVKEEKSKIVKVQNPYIINDMEKLTAFTNYYIKKDLEVTKPTFPQKPKKPKLPSAKEMIKGRYEKTKTFELRVESERKKRVRKIRDIEKGYAKKVKVFNEEVKRLTDGYNNALAKKQKDIENITTRAIVRAYATIYGEPYLDKNLNYDADREIFYGKIKSIKGDFSEQVAIKVPINRAENFEKSLERLKTKVTFDYEDGKLSLKKIVLTQDKTTYIGQLDTQSYQ